MMVMPVLDRTGDPRMRRLSIPYQVQVWRLVITVMPGFVTDGASVPQVLEAYVGCPFEEPRIGPAVIHDWLYGAHVTTRLFADMVFAVLLIRSGWPILWTITDFFAVRRFGGIAWRSKSQRDIDFARGSGFLGRIKTKG